MGVTNPPRPHARPEPNGLRTQVVVSLQGAPWSTHQSPENDRRRAISSPLGGFPPLRRTGSPLLRKVALPRSVRRSRRATPERSPLPPEPPPEIPRKLVGIDTCTPLQYLEFNSSTVLLVLAWLNKLLAPSGRPLNEVTKGDGTAEELLAEMDRVRAELISLRLEWGEMLDKLTRLAARASARQRMRAKRELDAIEPENDDQDEGVELPRSTQAPQLVREPEVVLPYNPRDKSSIRAYLRAQGR